MNRHENIKDLNLFIKGIVNEVYSNYNFDLYFLKKQIQKQVINEAGKKIIYNSLTGINKLEGLLKNILKTLETAYKSLTTDPKQRQSFSEHIVNAIQNMLDLKDREFYGIRDIENSVKESASNIEITFDNSKFGEDGVLKKDDDSKKEKSDEDMEIEEFTIPGMDETGRDDAFYVFNKIKNQIEDVYDTLRNKLDRTVFKQWLPKNLSSYMDSWDQEMEKVLDKVNV